MTQRVQSAEGARAAWEDTLLRPIGDLRGELAERDPAVIARSAGAELCGTDLLIRYWDSSYVIRTPSFECDCPPATLALLLYYLQTADGAPALGKWVAFRDLPGGTFYHSAFQGYAGNRLARVLGGQIGAFKYAAESLGGIQEQFGDAAYRFSPLPRVPVLGILWQADEEFEARGAVLFDGSAGHYLPIDACATLGSSLVQKLVRTVESRRGAVATSTTPLTSME